MLHPARLNPGEYQGHARHFFTLCTHQRRQHFKDQQLVSEVTAQFLQAAKRAQIAIPAYCFMPDHVHLLSEGTAPDADACRFIKDAKQRAGFVFKQRNGSKLWQKYYFDRALRSEESTEDVVAYIVANPLRARLVERIDDYPAWGSGTYTREQIVEFVQMRARVSRGA